MLLLVYELSSVLQRCVCVGTGTGVGTGAGVGTCVGTGVPAARLAARDTRLRCDENQGSRCPRPAGDPALQLRDWCFVHSFGCCHVGPILQDLANKKSASLCRLFSHWWLIARWQRECGAGPILILVSWTAWVCSCLGLKPFLTKYFGFIFFYKRRTQFLVLCVHRRSPAQTASRPFYKRRAQFLALRVSSCRSHAQTATPPGSPIRAQRRRACARPIAWLTPTEPRAKQNICTFRYLVSARRHVELEHTRLSAARCAQQLVTLCGATRRKLIESCAQRFCSLLG